MNGGKCNLSISKSLACIIESCESSRALNSNEFFNDAIFCALKYFGFNCLLSTQLFVCPLQCAFSLSRVCFAAYKQNEQLHEFTVSFT